MSETLSDSARSYHLEELRIARDPSSPAHLLPEIPSACRVVLDIGCGAGQTLIASDLPSEVLAFGIDPDKGALALGRTLSDQVHFASASGEDLPFTDGAFDMVISRVALLYMNIPRALAEISRVLRPGGRVWFSLNPPSFALQRMGAAIRAGSVRGFVFSLYTLANAFSLQISNRLLKWPFGRKRYESVQTTAGMKRSLQQAGFDDIRVERGRFFVVTARRG
jgi:SAM-dependent methyltransferase